MTRREKILALCEWDENETAREYIARLDKLIPVIIDENEKLREALEKIEDPRKRAHKEPDAYTTLGCVMNIATEALTQSRVEELLKPTEKGGEDE